MGRLECGAPVGSGTPPPLGAWPGGLASDHKIHGPSPGGTRYYLSPRPVPNTNWGPVQRRPWAGAPKYRRGLSPRGPCSAPIRIARSLGESGAKQWGFGFVFLPLGAKCSAQLGWGKKRPMWWAGEWPTTPSVPGKWLGFFLFFLARPASVALMCREGRLWS